MRNWKYSAVLWLAEGLQVKMNLEDLSWNRFGNFICLTVWIDFKILLAPSLNGFTLLNNKFNDLGTWPQLGESILNVAFEFLYVQDNIFE